MQVLGDDRFELRRLVAEGSYGEVYEAYDFDREQRVAVKLMFHSGRAADERFEREAGMLAELTHPSIVHYVAHGRSPSGQSYLVMEWLQGETLELRLRRKQMAVEEVISLAQRVVAGLAFAASKGIVHRDIKPGNLFLVGRDCAAAKILDLGLARRTREEQRLTRTGGIIGTPLYMSPEQARGARDVDPRSDVFSLGSVLYECLCIDRAFEGTHPVATLAKICMEEPVPVELNAPHVPTRLAKLVQSMLHKDRDRRPHYRWIALELSMIASGELGSQPAPRPQARSLTSAGERRVLCAVFLRGEAGALDERLETELHELAEHFRARRERLLDGSQILVIEAHPNAIDQAVSSAHCALALRALVADAPIAVATGKARIEDGSPLLGELLERGVRLLMETPRGAIRVDADSAALIAARFELHEHTLVRERSGGEAPRTLLGQPTRFVGRDRELAQLTLSFRECAEEQVARPVLVTAPPGAGKSRLRYELVESLRNKGDDFVLLVARGDAMRTGKQLGVLAIALRSWAGLDGEPDYEQLRTRIAGVVSLERVQPVCEFIGELIGMPFPDHGSPQLAAARRDPALMAERIQEAWLEWLRALSQRAAILLCVEDLHWSDPASVRLIDSALRTLSQRALMVLAFARPEVREIFPNLWSERDLTELRLPKLTARSCERVLDSALPGADPALRKSIIERADGNPFFLEELVRSLEERPDETSLPDSVLGVVQARLDGLGDPLKQVVRAASVFGATFSAEGVRALMDSDLARREVSSNLRALAEREVIFARGEDEFGFRHALTRDAAYLLLDSEQCESAHRVVAEFLAQRGAPATMLAEHWQRGARPERAGLHFARASAEALDAGSVEVSIRWGQRAVDCGIGGKLLGEVASRLALACSWLARDVDCLYWAELARRHHTPHEAPWWIAAQAGCIGHMRLGRSQEAAELMEEIAARMTPKQIELPEQASALSFISSEGLRLLHPAIAGRAFALLPEVIPADMKGRAQGYLLNAYCFQAYARNEKEAAIRYLRESQEVFRSIGAGLDACQCGINLGFMLFEIGANDEAEWTLLEHQQIAKEQGSLKDVAYSAIYLGALHARRHELAQAEQWLLVAVEGNEEVGGGTHEVEARGLLAEVRVEAGDLAGAQAVLEKAETMEVDHPPVRCAMYLAATKLELARGMPERAQAELDKAFELRRTQGDGWEYVGRIYAAQLACLRAAGRDDAELRRDANQWLDAQLARLADPALRQGFANLAEHRAIRG